MYEITPKRTNKAASYTSAAMIFTAFAAMLFSGISWLPYRSLMQLAALVILGFAILILVRYVLTVYVYAIIPTDNGGYDLTVTEARRKSRITVCRISLSGIESARTEDAKDKKALSEKAKGYKVFNYCVDLAPAEYYCIFAEECGEKILLKLTCDDEFIDIISRLTSSKEN